MEPYALKAGGGRTYHDGIDFTVKAGENQSTNGAAILEYVTKRGDEDDRTRRLSAPIGFAYCYLSAGTSSMGPVGPVTLHLGSR
jgi:hypothetical protein